MRFACADSTVPSDRPTHGRMDGPDRPYLAETLPMELTKETTSVDEGELSLERSGTILSLNFQSTFIFQETSFLTVSTWPMIYPRGHDFALNEI